MLTNVCSPEYESGVGIDEGAIWLALPVTRGSFQKVQRSKGPGKIYHDTELEWNIKINEIRIHDHTR